jgi:multicomponent Na+:H+ antiporter subunit D
MLAFTLAALSMIGLPPFAGFFSKWYLASGAVENGRWTFLVVILASSLLNAVYFFRILEKVYLKDPHSTIDVTANAERNEVPASMLVPTIVLALGLLVIGLSSALIVSTIRPLYE